MPRTTKRLSCTCATWWRTREWRQTLQTNPALHSTGWYGFARDGSHVQPYTQKKRRGALQNQCGGDRTTRESNSVHLPLRY